MENCTNLIYSFAKTLLITLLCTLGVGEMGAYNFTNTDVYFDNTNAQWDEPTAKSIYFFTEKYENSSLCSQGWHMSKVEGTNLFHINNNWGNVVHYYRFASVSYNTSGWPWEGGSSESRLINNSNCFGLTNIGVNPNGSNKTLLCISASGTYNNTAGIDLSSSAVYDSYTDLNHTQTVQKYTCTDGTSFTTATVNSGTITIEAYKMTAHGTASKTNNKQTINTSSVTSVNVDAAYTGEVTLTATANTGYVFLGWYDTGGTKLSESSEYTYNAPNSTKTIHARFAPKLTLSTLYLRMNNHTNWENDGARFAAVFCNATTQQWEEFSTPSGHMCSVDVPEGDWGYVIVCRMNPTRTGDNNGNNWENANRWNQTGDMMTYSTNNCVNITGDNAGSWTKYAPVPAIAGTMNDWSPIADAFNGSSGTVTCNVTLAAHQTYRFKVMEGTMWYGAGAEQVNDPYSAATYPTFIGQSDEYVLSTGTANLRMLSAGAGSYKFTYVVSTHTLSVEYPEVTHPTSDYVYFNNTYSWTAPKVHIWHDTNGGTAWGNMPSMPTMTFAGETYYYAAIGASDKMLVAEVTATDDNDKKTADLTISNHTGKYYDVVNKTTQSSEVAANWKDFTVTVSLYNQGATAPGIYSTTATYGSAMVPIAANNLPAKTGNTFEGYYDAVGGGGTKYYNADGTSAHVWDKTIASPKLYAKWNCTITLDGRSPSTAGTESITATYSSNTNLTSAIEKPTKTGWTFAGYYTLDKGWGLQLIDKDGNFNSNVTEYLDASGNWIGSGNVNLYAYWKDPASADHYTIRYGDNGSTDWTSQAFSQVGETNEWTISDFTIPNKNRFYIGYNEDFYNSDLGSNSSESVTMDWTTAYSEGNGAMKLLPGTSAVGLATGAVGTLQIWDNSADKNLSVGFLPSGYALVTDDRILVLKAGESNSYYSDPITITSTEAAGTFQVQLKASSGYVATAHGAAEYASTLNGRKVSGDADIANGKKGVFQMWNNSATNNFGLRFVTVYDVSFDLQDHGSAIADYTDVCYGNTIGAPSDPSENGYAFGGWYKEAECENEWDFENDVVTKATTLYAKWTRVYAFIEGRLQVHNSDRSSTTTIGANNTWATTSSMMPMDYDGDSHLFYRRTYSTPAELQAQIDEKGQFFFIHTSTAENSVTGGNAYYAPAYPDNRLPSAGTKVTFSTSNNGGVAFSGTETAYVIIYFDGTDVWYELECALSYSGNGNTGGSTPATRDYYTYGTNQAALANTYTKTGYEFTNWNTASDGGGTTYAPGATTVTMNAAEVVLYAQWKFVIYRTGDAPDGGAETFTGGTINWPIEYRMKVGAVDKWYSLSLPFIVNSVQVWDDEDLAYYPIIPYHRDDDIFYEGHYVIRTPYMEKDMPINNFSYWVDPKSHIFTPNINTPYIILWHDSWFEGKYISFFGDKNQTIPTSMSEGDEPSAADKLNVYGNNAMIGGSVDGAYTFDSEYGGGAWLCNDDKSERTVPPFECFIRAKGDAVIAAAIAFRPRIYPDSTPTGWDDVLNSITQTHVSVYTITGFKVTEFDNCSFAEVGRRLKEIYHEGIFILRSENESVKLMLGGN